jgi:hypothetical protein
MAQAQAVFPVQDVAEAHLTQMVTGLWCPRWANSLRVLWLAIYQVGRNYVVESARVIGQPRIVNQAYLGSDERVAALVKDRTSPVPLLWCHVTSACPALSGSRQSKPVSLAYWRRSRPRLPDAALPRPATCCGQPSTASVHRGPDRGGDWYSRILQSVCGIPPVRFTSQAFWDAFKKILPEQLDPRATGDDDPPDRAQLRLLDLMERKAEGELTPARL